MTFIARWWEAAILAFMAPFVKIKQDNFRLNHTIEMDKVAVQNRHIETILDSQKDLAKSMQQMMENNNSVIKEWLEGFHKLPTNGPNKAPAVNDDERMWRLEMENMFKQRGKSLTENMSPYEIEALIQNEFNSL